MADAIGAVLDRLPSFDRPEMRRWVEDRYGPARVADALLALYDGVLAEGPVAEDSATAEIRGGGSTGRVERPIVVVGFDRARLSARWATLPATVGVSQVVTARGAAPVLPERWSRPPVEADLDAPFRRTMGSRRSLPARWYHSLRRDNETWRADVRLRSRLATAQRVVDDALAGLASPTPALLLPIDGFDHQACLPALTAGRAIAAPGALRWLADASLPDSDGGSGGGSVGDGLGDDRGDPGSGAAIP